MGGPAGGRVAGKKALVTGAAQGIGAAIAWMLARHGARVALSDLNPDGAAAVAEAINAELGAGTASAHAHDVRLEADWIRVVGEAAATMGGLSVLVNNAGIAVLGTVEQLSLEEWHRCMAVNSDAVFLGCKHSLAAMRDHQPGSIVNISSVAGLVAAHNFTAYNASKSAVWMLTKSVALHCARQKLDIRCNSVHPTFVRTPILEGLSRDGDMDKLHGKLAAQVPLGRLGEPDDIAYGVLYLASDESRFMTAAELKLDGGLSAM